MWVWLWRIWYSEIWKSYALQFHMSSSRHAHTHECEIDVTIFNNFTLVLFCLLRVRGDTSTKWIQLRKYMPSRITKLRINYERICQLRKDMPIYYEKICLAAADCPAMDFIVAESTSTYSGSPPWMSTRRSSCFVLHLQPLVPALKFIHLLCVAQQRFVLYLER